MYTKLAFNKSLPIPYDVLREQYKTYGSPKDKIARLVADGNLIRLKKGLFLANTDRGDESVSLELIANTLRGPSYVSLQTALSYYGLIPERVYAIRSMTTKRSKTYQTPVGRFEYITAREEMFSIGVRSVGSAGSEKPTNAGFVSFLMASPEKAICDMIVATPRLRIQSAKAMREYMEEDMRIDISEIAQLDYSVLESVIQTGVKKREIELLMEYCKNAEQFI